LHRSGDVDLATGAARGRVSSTSNMLPGRRITQ
jgi:hypothetical protein